MKKLFRMLLMMLVLTMGTGLTSCDWSENGDNPVIPVGSTVIPVNLAALTSADVNADGEFVVTDGTILTGTLDGETQKIKIAIADGATVTLSNATINGKNTDDSHELWAGLTCLGDATIILEGTNAVQNFNRHYPGLQPGPEGTTLTIRGNGSLTATSREYGAGIGTKYEDGSCGNIRIEGGTVTATGHWESAGIGSSYVSTCGDITITGGTVTASGGTNGAGIGTGNSIVGRSRCGDITISGGTVKATGSGHGAGIGTGRGNYDDDTSQCGTITISGSAQVTATGDNDGAGIGTGQFGKCGNISISGGTVMARGVNSAPGIGTGQDGRCGDISITKGKDFDSVTAIRGSGANRSIGTYDGFSDYLVSVCGRITFGGKEIFNGIDDFYDVPEDKVYGDLRFTKTTTDDGNDDTDDTTNTWTLK